MDFQIDPGRFRYRPTIRRNTITYVNGAEQRTPQDVATVSANIEFLSGNEAFKAKQVDASVNARITMRYRADLRESDQFFWNAWRMEIRSILPTGQRQQWLVVMCAAQRVTT